jgi:hypothetical protein
MGFRPLACLSILLVAYGAPASGQSECYVADLNENWREPVSEVVVRGDTAFVAVGKCLDMVDIAVASAPVRIGRIVLPDIVRDVALVGSMAFIANHREGLRLVSVLDPSAPEEVGVLPLRAPLTAEHVAAVAPEQVLVGVDGTNLLYRIDASDPSGPVLDDSLYTSSSQPLAIAIREDVALVADADSVYIVAASGGTPLQRFGAFSAYAASDIVFEGAQAYVAELESPDSDSGRLRIVDVSDPDAVLDVGIVPTAFGYEAGVSGGLAVVGGANGDIEVFDTSDPSAPVYVTSLEAMLPPITNPASVTVSGTTAFVGHVSEGLFLFDVSDPANPSLVGQYAPVATSTDALPEAASPALSLSVYPNPVRETTTLEVVVAQSQRVAVRMFDVLGREVQVVHEGTLAAGGHPFAVATQALPAGVYVVRVEGTARAITERFVRVK